MADVIDYNQLEGTLGTLTPSMVAVFACCCAERTAGLLNTSTDPVIPALGRQVLDLSWRALDRQNEVSPQSQILIDRLLGQLGEDSNFGPNHSIIFDAILCVGYAGMSVAARAGSSKSTLSEAILAARSEISLIKVSYFERHGTYSGADSHESLRRGRSWQARDASELEGARISAAKVDLMRLRARKESVLTLAGVIDGDWSQTLPDDEWPTLF